LINLGQEAPVNCCEHGNEPLGSIICRQFFE